nr:dTMP kinase [Allorhizobium sonneratiae]
MFITFEGGEGTGKSTQIALLTERLTGLGFECVKTREPGGSPSAEALRHVLLSGAAEAFGSEMEAILFAAARYDHVDALIRPALRAGRVVLCDRFMDSSRVYQGLSGTMDMDFIDKLQMLAVDGAVPDLTLVLDLPASSGLARAQARAEAAGLSAPDRFEKETNEVHEARRQGFLQIAAAEPERCRVIDAAMSREQVADAIFAEVQPLLHRLRPTRKEC